MGFDYSKTRQGAQSISLNDLLDQLEVDLSRVGQGRFENAQNLLVKMDEAQQRIETMALKELQVKAEAAQFDYLVTSLEKNAGKLLNDLGGAKQLDSLRKQKPTGINSRWWYLDEIIARQRKKSISKIFISLGIAGLLLVILIVGYDNFLKPDPAVTGKYTHQMNAEQFLSSGDYTKALDEINLALGFYPTDPGLLVMRGVIQTRLGNNELASADFNSAETTLGNHVDFLLLRTQSWLSAGDLQNSLADAQEIIREDPTSAEGYFYLGRVNEVLRNYSEAINAYETASKLADSQGKSELNATIRISLAMLMQSAQGGLQDTPQPQTPTP